MQLQVAVQTVFSQLSTVLGQLSKEAYTKPSIRLSHHSIGQHFRHIIELFQCLEEGYTAGVVNYENRRRDTRIETDKDFAASLLPDLYKRLQLADKPLVLEATYSDHSETLLSIQSNYIRELAYNLEHAIHHMALIRVGVEEVADLALPEHFGIAPSTVKHRNSCAQ